MNHKQKKSKEDAPQWYIDAYLESLRTGLGVIVIRDGQDIEQIPPEKYLELAEALIAKHQEYTSAMR